MNKETIQHQEIVYLTGLSVDKGRLHNIFKQVATDPDFTEFINAVSSQVIKREFHEKAKNKIKKVYYHYDILNKLNDVAGVFGNDLFNFASNQLTGNTVFALKAFKLLFLDIAINHYLSSSEKGITSVGLKKLNNDIEQFFGTTSVRERLNNYQNLDFFRIYLSNQSDSRGVSALASGVTHEDDCYTVNWGYSDGPFYNNEFIDSIYFQFTQSFNDQLSFKHININKKTLANNSKLLTILLENIFFVHGADIIASRIVSDRGGKQALTDKEKTSWWVDFDKKLKSDDSIETFVRSMGDRALFGIDLLSRIFATLLSVIEDGKKLNLYLNIQGLEKEYIHELIEYANSPGDIIIVNEVDQADVIVSSQMLPSYHMSGEIPSWFYTGKNNADNEKLRLKNNFPFFIKTVESADSAESISLKIPIKMFLSLPFVEGKPSKKALLPSQLVYSDIDTVDDKVINVFTVGGAEHNRPLMRLVNKARQDYREDRMFGFMDNVFDFFHRLQHHEDRHYRHLFVMGVNQPVSGFNRILATRLNDEAGKSISNLAKQLYFETHCDYLNRKINVLSIYGFSAVTSAYTTAYSILKIKQACAKSHLSGVPLALSGIMDFSQIEDKKQIRIYQSRGIAVLLEFSSGIEKLISIASEDFDYFSGMRIQKIRKKLEVIFSFSGDDIKNEGIKDRILGRVQDE